jgi:RNA polymerase sigma-70 factor, ECF subfamily
MSHSSTEPDFTHLVDSYYEDLYRFALSMARNEADASDLVQQTFLIWAEKGSGLRDSTKAKSWLFTTLYREFLRQYRRGTSYTSLEPDQLDQSKFAATPVDQAISIDGQTAIKALQSIPEVYRIPLTLFYLEDFSYREIADTLDMPIGTVMSRLSRGKALLKQNLTSPME